MSHNADKNPSGMQPAADGPARSATNASAPDKVAIRRSVLARRAQVSTDEARLAGLAVAKRLSGFAQWRDVSEVLIYCAIRGEVETRPLIEDLWEKNIRERPIRVLAPRCRPGGKLDLACVTCLSDLSPGTLGIPEPHPDRCQSPEAFAPDVALIPAVAFDRSGNRLGFGQGYYDRLLASPAFANTLLIGVAHDFQIVDALPSEPWDRPVHVVATPSEVIWTS